jgi:MFS transporter, SHS family, lactate transporter
VNLFAVPKHDYRVLFWTGAAISLGAAIIRLILPESQYFIERQAASKLAGTQVSSAQKSKIFISEGGKALRLHWIRCIFAILLMTGFNFLSQFRPFHYKFTMPLTDPRPSSASPSLLLDPTPLRPLPVPLAAHTTLIHSSGSQDLYPTILIEGHGLSKHAATVGTILGNVGAIVSSPPRVQPPGNSVMAIFSTLTSLMHRWAASSPDGHLNTSGVASPSSFAAFGHAALFPCGYSPTRSPD